MERAGKKTRDIQFFSEKNGGMVCLHSPTARDYAKYLEKQPWVESYEAGAPLSEELYCNISPVGIRGLYFKTSWVSDFLLHFADGRRGIRELVRADNLQKASTVERLEFSKDGRPGRYSSFICGNYARSGKSACTIHTIYEDVLKELVLADIREKAQYAEYDRERLLARIIRMKDKEQHSRVASCEQELKVTAARVHELEKLMQNLYEDKCTGVVPQTVFQTLMQKYETERAQKAAALPELERRVQAQLENRHDADRWAGIIRRYTEITELDETILFELVDRIEVGEARREGNLRICDIKVFYRYVGNVDDALVEERQAV